MTKDFIQQCKTLSKNSIIYFLVTENRLRECVENQLIVFIKILKNYGHNAFLFRNTDYTSQKAYLLTRVIFAPNVYNDFSEPNAELSPLATTEETSATQWLSFPRGT